MRPTEHYDNAAREYRQLRKAGGLARTGTPIPEPAVAATVHDQYVPQGMLCIGSASGACPEWIGIDAPILRDRDSDADDETGDLGQTGSGLDERLYYLTDAHMNVTAVTNTTGAVVERYHYDPYPNGRYVHHTYGDGDANDVLSRVAAIRNDNAGSPGATVFAAYSYDGAGRVVVEDYAQPDVRLDLVDLAAWAATPGTYAGLDRFGRIKQQWWRDYGAAADVDKLAYGYDRNSNRLYRENVVSGSQGTPVHLDELYHYDRLNRLQDANRGDLNANHNAVSSTSLRQTWTLDDLGNWSAFQTDTDGNAPWGLDHSREHNQANEIADTSGNGDAIETTTGTDWANPAHDARGNMTTMPDPNDPANAYTCTYDAWNRLVKVADGATTVAEYRYDGLHRRIARLVPDGQNWDRTDFYYTRSWQVIEQRFANAQADKDAVATAAKYQYVWSLRYIDACILRDEDKDADGDCTDAEGAGGSERLYYASGANMEVTAVVNASGAVQERYTYTPYGQVTRYNPDWSDEVTWANSRHNEILFCGYRYDGESGLYDVRYRMYHPALGRWIQRDPLGYADGMGFQEYVGSGPLTHVDPVGLWRATISVASRPYVEPALRETRAGGQVHVCFRVVGGCMELDFASKEQKRRWQLNTWVEIVYVVTLKPKTLKKDRLFANDGGKKLPLWQWVYGHEQRHIIKGTQYMMYLKKIPGTRHPDLPLAHKDMKYPTGILAGWETESKQEGKVDRPTIYWSEASCKRGLNGVKRAVLAGIKRTALWGFQHPADPPNYTPDGDDRSDKYDKAKAAGHPEYRGLYRPIGTVTKPDETSLREAYPASDGWDCSSVFRD